MTEAELLARVVARPTDLDARRVYADWLLDHGDARGEYIALACRLAERPSDEELAEEVGDLGAALGDDIVLPGLAGIELGAGFVEKVELTAARFVELGPSLVQKLPLRRLSLFGLGPLTVDDVAQSPALDKIEELQIAAMPLSVGDDELLTRLLASPHLSSLRRLKLSLSLSPAGAWALAETALPSLRDLELEVRGNGVSIGENGGAFLGQAAWLPQLRRLSLRRQSLRAKGTAGIVARLDAIEHLDLGFADLGPEGADALARARLPSLRTLDVGGNLIGVAAARRLVGSLHQLTELGLGGNNRIGSQGIGEVLSAAPSLERLELDGARLRTEGSRALAASPVLRRLHSLSLAGSDLGDDGVTALAASRHLTMLAELVLTSNGIGDVGANALGMAPWLAHVRRLQLADNRLGNRGAQLLGASPNLSSLRELNIDRNQVGARGIEALLPGLALRSLTVGENPCGDAVLAQSTSLRSLFIRDVSTTKLAAYLRSPAADELRHFELTATVLDHDATDALCSRARQLHRLTISHATQPSDDRRALEAAFGYRLR